jgi:hypothetical protein
MNYYHTEHNNYLNEVILILLYKQETIQFQEYNFADKRLSPLIFSYFNSLNQDFYPKGLLKEFLQGYLNDNLTYNLSYSFNNDFKAYVPRIGYFNKNNQLELPIKYICESQIEIIEFSHPLLDFVFFQAFSDKNYPTDFCIGKSLNDRYFNQLSRSVNLIKQFAFEHFKLIEEFCSVIVLFKTDPSNTNSFATINAHGAAFFNVYQEDYDEVFFIDDIAHQTGHIILTSITGDRKKVFLINENESIADIVEDENEYRSFYVLFHALYTYYTTTLCLDRILKSKKLNRSQSIESIARIGFYLKKYKSDLDKFNLVERRYNSIDLMLTESGIEIYKVIAQQYDHIFSEWGSIVGNFSYHNQPYNYTHKEFLKFNIFDND